jgi:hypothetical protein
MKKVTHHSFKRLLKIAGENSSVAGLFVLSLGANAAATALPEPIDPALLGALGGVGWGAFETSLGKATNDDISNEELLWILQKTLDEVGFEKFLTEQDFYRGLRTLLEREQDMLAELLSGTS